MFLLDRKEVIPCRGTEGRKGTGTKRGKSGTRNLETDGISSRAESMGGCRAFETVTKIRQSIACDIFVAESNLSCSEFFVGLAATGRTEAKE